MEEPVIQRIDFNAMPIISIAVESPTADIKALSSLAEKVIKKRLETVPGVGQVNLVGLARREIQIFLDRDKLKSYGLTYAQIAQALARENMDVPAGKLEQGRQEPLVRVAGKFRSMEAFDHLIVAVRNGRPIFLPMVARVVDGIEERTSASLIDGKPGLSLDVVKQSGANTVEVADAIDRSLREINADLPSHIRLRTVVDRSTFIRESVEDVQVTLVLGGLLTVLIVFLFLNSWRSTVITGLALPVSVISTFIVMRALGFTLNILTLMGLSLAIGLLIDDAIVVRENIVRHMHAGADHFTAAREATAEIGLAVMATTFTIIAVFVPVAFMGGIIGRFFFQFGITVGFAVLVSLYVSFTLDPMLSSRWYDPAADPRVPRSWFGRGLGRVNEQLDRLQKRARRRAGLVAAASLGGGADRPPWRCSRASRSSANSARPSCPTRTRANSRCPTRRTRASAWTVPSKSRKSWRPKSAAIPGVAYTYTTIGGNASKPINEGNIFIRLKPRKTARRTTASSSRKCGGNWRASARCARRLKRPTRSAATSKPIQISVRGADLARLAPLGEQLMAEIRQVPGPPTWTPAKRSRSRRCASHLDRNAAGDLGSTSARSPPPCAAWWPAKWSRNSRIPTATATTCACAWTRSHRTTRHRPAGPGSARRRAVARWCRSARWRTSKPAPLLPRSAAAT